MVVVSLTNEEKICYGIFSWLRRNVDEEVDIVTLKQISIYISKCYDSFNPRVDFNLYYNTIEHYYELIFNDGRKLIFDNKKFGFKILKEDKNISMLINVCDFENIDVCGVVRVNDDEVYVVTTLDNNLKTGVITYYNDNNILTNTFYSDIYFDIPVDFNSPLDFFNGKLGNFLSRIDLLYNNVSVIKKVKVKKVS